MSWILGFVGQSLSRERRARLDAFVKDPLVKVFDSTYFLAAGGIPETCIAGGLPEKRGHWCVIGTGVVIDDDQARILKPADWLRRLQQPRPQFDTLGGGFVVLRVTAGRVEAFNDICGLRSLYWIRTRDGFLYSSRPEWLTALGGGLTIDWPTFGSHWLTYNQLSSRSLVGGLERLGPGGYLALTDAGFNAASNPYTLRPHIPPEEHRTPDVRDLLKMLLEPTDPRTVSLGLSGGIDSRTLLALTNRHDRFAVHVFGPRTKADVRVALTLAEEEGVPLSHFNFPPPELDSLLEIVRNHAVQSQAVSPASSALSLRYYPELRSQRKLVVDGAFGEILRRQFMNRLARRGSDAVRKRDPERAVEFIRYERAPIFSTDVRRKMETGIRHDLVDQLNELPTWRLHGVENILDLLNVRTRLPNFFGYEQARLDALVQSYMPFAHPLALDAVFRIPSSRRSGGRVSRKIIARRAPRFRRYPLVKGEITYPYGLPSLIGTLWVKVQKKLQVRLESDDRSFVLDSLKEFVLDRIHSASVKGNPEYDWKSLNRIAEAYYSEGTHGEQLDWWLAFDLWREAVVSAV